MTAALLLFLLLPLLGLGAGLLFWRRRVQPLDASRLAGRVRKTVAPYLFALQNVCKVYPNRRGDAVVAFALDGPPLFIKPGLTAIIGKSGRGKTTALGLLAGLDTPSGGRVWYAGRPLPAAECLELQKHRAHHVSFVFQSLNLIGHYSALNNVALALESSGVPRAEALERAMAALKAVELSDDKIQRRPGELSGGEQQRIAVARALASNAEVILADEPTGALDAVNARNVMDMFKKLARRTGKSVVLVTHNTDLAEEFADRIVQLNEDGGYTVFEVESKEAPASDKLPRSDLSAARCPGLGWRSCLRFAWSDLKHRLAITCTTIATVVFSVFYLLAIGMVCLRIYDTHDQAMLHAQLDRVAITPEDANAIHLRITDKTLTELRDWPEVRIAFRSVERLANFSLNPDKQHLLVLASTAPGDPQSSDGLVWGRGIEEGKEQAVISRAVLTRLGGALTSAGPEPRQLTLEVQRKFDGKDQIERRSLPIVGITRHDMRDRVYVPLALARQVNQWSRGAIADLDGRRHKDEDKVTFPRAFAYGPAEEEDRALKELGEQKLEVKKVGAVSMVKFAGPAWASVDGAAQGAFERIPRDAGIQVLPAYRAKSAGQTWIAWDQGDPRWEQVRDAGRDELGWIGSERDFAAPALAQRQRIPPGLVPADTRLVRMQTLRWLLFDPQKAELARGELVRTSDLREAVRQEAREPGSVWSSEANLSIMLRPAVEPTRAVLEEACKRHGRNQLTVAELPGAPLVLDYLYAKGVARREKRIVLRASAELLHQFVDPRKSPKPLAILRTANPKTAPTGVIIAGEPVDFDAVVASEHEQLLLERAYRFEPFDLQDTRLWVQGPWHTVGEFLSDSEKTFRVEDILSKPAAFTMLAPKRDVQPAAHAERRVAATTFLLGEVRIDRKKAAVKVVPHTGAGLRTASIGRLYCSASLVEMGRCELRTERAVPLALQAWSMAELPPNVVIVHDDVFNQLAFQACDRGIMPDGVEKVTALGVARPMLMPALEELAARHKHTFHWLTPMERSVMNKYEVKEKAQPMKRETIAWLSTMKPAIEIAEVFPTLGVRVRGDAWTLVGCEPRSPLAFETKLCAGAWLDAGETFQVVLPVELAKQEHVSVGDAITVQVLRNEVKAEQPIAIRLKIVGLSSATEPCVSVQLCREIALWRSRVMEFNEARHRFELPDAAQNDMGDHRAVLFARSEAHVKPLVQKLRERGYQTEDRLQEMEGMRHLSVVLTAFAGFFVFGFVVMSLITVMVTTLMHVQAKQHEIGILRGLGLSWTNVLYIYVLQGLFIGAASFVLAALLFALTGNGLRGFVADLFSIKDPVFTEGGPFSGGAMLYLLAFAACLTVVQSCLGVVAGCWRACRMLPSDALRHRV